MPLSDAEIRAIKPSDVDQKHFDGGGLYLLVKPNGSKLWKLKFRVGKTEKKLSFGRYPVVSLRDARLKRDEAKRQIADGADPAEQKRLEKVAAEANRINTFGAVAEEFLNKREKEGLADTTTGKARWLLSHLTPALGKRPIAEIDAPELLRVLKKIEESGKRETAKRLRSLAGRIFRYGVATGRCSNDPSWLLRGALLAPIVKHHAAIVDPTELGKLLRAIDGYKGQPATITCLRLTPHVFQRPGEVRQMRWDEIDFEKAIWSIPAERMKKRRAHTMPLSRQALGMLKEMQIVSGSEVHVFPAMGKRNRALSNNTLNSALRRLGYDGDEMTTHGFRSTATSLLNESGKWNPDAIERALSRADSNQVRAIYNRTQYWDERVEMAQWWSDYLDTLKSEALAGKAA